MASRGSAVAKGFNWTSKFGVIVSWVALLAVAIDVFVGIGLQFELKDIGIAAFIAIVTTIIRIVGMWFMRVTGAFD